MREPVLPPLEIDPDVRRARTVLGRVLVRPPVVRSRLAAPTFVDRVHAAGYPVLAHRQPLSHRARPSQAGGVRAGAGKFAGSRRAP